MKKQFAGSLRPFVRIRGVHVPRGRDGRVRFGKLVAALVLIGILLMPSDLLPPILYWLLFAGCALVGFWEDYTELRRQRPRTRMLYGGTALIVLCAVFGLMAVFIATGVLRDDPGMWPLFLVLSGVSLAAGVWCLMRWRRLRAEAEIRLWSLRKSRIARRI